MNGIIIYQKEDISIEYVNWLIDEFKKECILLELVYYECFLINGIEKKVEFIINKTRDVSLTYMFELNNIRVFNNSCISELSSNKLRGYAHAKNNGLTTADILIKKQNNDLIRKPVDGHGGENISLTKEFLTRKNYLCQKYIDNTIGDVRFYVVGNKIINSVIRKNEKSFLHNYKKGAKVEVYSLDDYSRESVNKFLNGIYCDFVGIDFLLLNTGELVFNEIEDVCGSRMLSMLNINNTTSEFIKQIKTVLQQ